MSPQLTKPQATEQVLPMVQERRGADRVRTVFRVARVRSRADEGLARVQNISDTGIRLTTGLSPEVGETLEIWLTDNLICLGRVAWVDEAACGVEFLHMIDCVDALRRAAEEARLGKVRPPRLPMSQPVVVFSERGLCVTRLYDVSQRGMKIGNNGDFQPGVSVKVVLAPGMERRGCIRWVRNDMAGVILTEPFSVQELGSANKLLLR